MRILGIDPGSRKAGFGIIELKRSKITYVDSGILRFEKWSEFNDRLPHIYSQTRELIEIYGPDEIALESLIYHKSPTALIKLAQARGIMMAALMADSARSLAEYSPNLVKMSTVGHGHAEKESVQKFLNMLLGPRKFQSHDESDALAVAICHAVNRRKVQSSTVGLPKSRGKRSLKDALNHKTKGF